MCGSTVERSIGGDTVRGELKVRGEVIDVDEKRDEDETGDQNPADKIPLHLNDRRGGVRKSKKSILHFQLWKHNLMKLH